MASSPDGLGMVDAGGMFPLAGRMKGLPNPQYGEGNVPEWVPDSLVEAMRADDVDGSGVFDTRKNTHEGQGIFASKGGSLPGYAARESGLGPSEVVDAQTDTAIEVFLPGLVNHRPMHGQIQHRWPLAQGENVPNHQMSADRIDFERAIFSKPTWNDPSAGTGRPIEPTHVRPGAWGMDPRHLASPATQIAPAPATAGYGAYEAMGDVSSTGSSLWMWALAGVGAGVVLALGWDYVKGR